MAAPAISVLLPVYNGERYLAEAVDSVLGQSFGDFELILIDDGSTDGSPELIARYEAADARVRPLRLGRNLGLIGALNAALREARAPLIARMDADDISFPRRFAVQKAYLDDKPQCLAVSGSFITIDAEGATVGKYFTPGEALEGNPWGVPPKEPYLPHPFLTVRREPVLKLGGYRMCLHSEDADLLWRLAREGELGGVDEIVGKYRVHAQNVSSASVTNGQVQTLMAAVAAVSEQRFRKTGYEIEADEFAAIDLAGAASWRERTDAVAGRLGATALERDYLIVASVLKFLQNTSFRPYSVPRDDWAFVNDAVGRGVWRWPWLKGELYRQWYRAFRRGRREHGLRTMLSPQSARLLVEIAYRRYVRRYLRLGR
ncbi:MAG TPA: glycosyltransferase family 2 protein [Hyphomicrobiales bacterium]|nr:glycosyltransferase family 2 protein [Hyphomicrobiales bacterium]